jgi:hypothetical protein
MGRPKTSTLIDCKLRIREDLRRRLDAAAAKRGVFRAHEIVIRLEKSFDPDPIIVLAENVERLLAMQSGKANT